MDVEVDNSCATGPREPQSIRKLTRVVGLYLEISVHNSLYTKCGLPSAGFRTSSGRPAAPACSHRVLAFGLVGTFV